MAAISLQLRALGLALRTSAIALSARKPTIASTAQLLWTRGPKRDALLAFSGEFNDCCLPSVPVRSSHWRWLKGFLQRKHRRRVAGALANMSRPLPIAPSSENGRQRPAYHAIRSTQPEDVPL